MIVLYIYIVYVSYVILWWKRMWLCEDNRCEYFLQLN